jgi:predicted DNA-binding transcriptional regulator AlpA
VQRLPPARRRTIDPMDEPRPTPNTQDSILLVTLNVAQLREIVREEIQAGRAAHQDPDRLLDAEEAAKLLSMSTDWLYRHAKKLPFTRKLGPKMLRFSHQGIVKWMATRKLS